MVRACETRGALKRSPAFIALVAIALLAVGVPIAIVLGFFGVYFLFGGVSAFITGILAVTGVPPLPQESPRSLLLIGPAMAAIGVIALAGVGGYFWIAATVVRALRNH